MTTGTEAISHELQTYGLTELGYKILIDRYAQKDPNGYENLQVGDVVIVILDNSSKDIKQKRELGVIESVSDDTVDVYLYQQGETITHPRKLIDRPLETTPDTIHKRIAKGAGSIEPDKGLWNERFQWLLDDWKFVPGGRIMTACGTDQDLTFMNCFVIESPEDSRTGIMKTLTQMAEIMSRGGGVGINVSTLRPRNAYVAGVNGRSSGSVSWGGLYSYVTGLIEQAGCLTGSMEVVARRFAKDDNSYTGGTFAIKDIVDGFKSGLSFQALTTDGYKPVTDVFVNGIKEVFLVTTEDGQYIEATGNHPFYTDNNNSLEPRQLSELKVGDKVMKWKDTGRETFWYGSEITNIIQLGEQMTYDITVEDEHMFVANNFLVGNSRRGALMLILNDWHPDVFDFVQSKRTAGRIENANISVGVSDAFMNALKTDSYWDLKFPDTASPHYDDEWDGNIELWEGKGYPVIIHKTIKARELWDAITESAWASAEPGLWFRERANNMSNSYYYSEGNLIATNPCGEQSLSAFSACNLGAVNLSKFYDETTGDVNWNDLKTAVRYGVRFLDNIIDLTMYPIPEAGIQQKNERRVGLGIMGLAELMIKLGIRYGSIEGAKFVETLFEFMARHAYLMSAEIASEKGSFPNYDEDILNSGFLKQWRDDKDGQQVLDSIKENGLRNVTLITVAPTGSTGTMVNTSTGIEPFFSWSWYRQSRLGFHEETIQIVNDYMAEHDIESYTDLPEYFVTAMDLLPKEHVDMQASAQKWTDSSISKTVNCPNEWTVEQVDELYRYMYDSGCKGGTIYRDGSRSEQVLIVKEPEQEQEVETKSESHSHLSIETSDIKRDKRQTTLKGVTMRGESPFGTVFITISEDPDNVPYEVFVSIGKSGTDLKAQGESIGRMISVAMQALPVEKRFAMLKLMVEQNIGIGGGRQAGFGMKRIYSLPDAIAQLIQREYIDPKENKQTDEDTVSIAYLDFDWNTSTSGSEIQDVSFVGANMCPECGQQSLVRQDGCSKCSLCGHSEC